MLRVVRRHDSTSLLRPYLDLPCRSISHVVSAHLGHYAIVSLKPIHRPLWEHVSPYN